MNTQEKTKNLEQQDNDQPLNRSLDDSNNSLKQAKQMHVEHHIEYNGPLPIPSHLEAYENILPGSADRIITMAEKEAEHRHDMETKAIEFAQRDARRGQTFTFIIVMASLIGGIILILNGDSIIGFASLISSLAILAGAFIYDNKKNQNDKK